MTSRALAEARAAGPAERGGGDEGVIVAESGVDGQALSLWYTFPRDGGHNPRGVELAAWRVVHQFGAVARREPDEA